MEARISIVTLGVADLERSWRFYKEGLGFPTTRHPESGIIFFQTGGVCLAHNTKSKGEVDEILKLAESAGGRIEKPAENVFWGGYSGYFSDPDGYYWEVAYADDFKFNADGSLVIE